MYVRMYVCMYVCIYVCIGLSSLYSLISFGFSFILIGKFLILVTLQLKTATLSSRGCTRVL